MLASLPRQTYFEDNPRDLQLLRHDLPLHPAVVKPHLGHIPDYLGEQSLGGALGQEWHPSWSVCWADTGPWRLASKHVADTNVQTITRLNAPAQFPQ